MSSWTTCPCGAKIHTNPFAGAEVYRLVRDSDYDAVNDPVDREALESLFFKSGKPAYRCAACGRIAVEWDGASPVFYLPEQTVSGKGPVPPGTDEERADDIARLEKLVALAESEYGKMYDPLRATGAYSGAKDAFIDAMALARKLGLEDEARKLGERLEHVKAVFRKQFP
jgi:hypothetical protein